MHVVQNSKGITGYTLEITPTRASPYLAATSSEGAVVATFLCSFLEIIYAQTHTCKLPLIRKHSIRAILCLTFPS